MGFIVFIGVVGGLWLLWNISENTGAALDKQTAIQYEIVALEKRLEELSSQLEGLARPAVGSEVVAGAAVAEDSVQSSVDINLASQKQLQTLPGVGPALAKRIIAARPFAVVSDLAKVEGISSDMLDKLRGWVRTA